MVTCVVVAGLMNIRTDRIWGLESRRRGVGQAEMERDEVQFSAWSGLASVARCTTWVVMGQAEVQ